MIRRPPRSTRKESSAASDVYKRQLPVQASSLGRNYSEWNLDGKLKSRLEDFGDSPLQNITRRRIAFPSQTLMGNHQDLQNQLERPKLEAGAGVSARQSRHVGDSPLAETPSPSFEFGQKLFGMQLELQFEEPPRRLWGLTPPIHQSKKNYISEPDPYGKSPRPTESA